MPTPTRYHHASQKATHHTPFNRKGVIDWNKYFRFSFQKGTHKVLQALEKGEHLLGNTFP